MTLTDLLNQHEKCREQLIAAINRDADQSEIQSIDTRLTTIIAAIENLELHDPHDIMKQVGFFLSQSETDDELAMSSANLKSVDTLVSRYAFRFGAQQVGLGDSRCISSKLKITLDGHAYSTKEMIRPLEARVSLFNTEFRYQFTSVGNAKFYDASPSDFVGKHVLEVIGKQRFASRAKARLESCFSGAEQRYFHFLHNAGEEERLMGCHMAPYYDGDDCIRGAYVAMEDITDKFESARQNSHIN